MNVLNQQVSESLGNRGADLAAHAVEQHFAQHPEIDRRYGETGRVHCRKDAEYHLAYLAQAIAADSEPLFADYVAWARVMLGKRGVPTADLAGFLVSMKESLEVTLPAEHRPLVCRFLESTLRQLPRMPDEIPPFIREGTPDSLLAGEYLRLLLVGDRDPAGTLILDAARKGKSMRDLYLHVFEPVQHEIGRLWQLNRISVAQEHYCTAATQHIIAQLYPGMRRAAPCKGTVVGTTISGDLHELGARMVCDFFEMEGWQAHYLGADVPAGEVIQTVVRFDATLLAVSATIAFHVPAVATLIAAVRQAPGCGGVIILVGGYPFNVARDLWRTVAADGGAEDAPGAVATATRLTTQSGSA